MNNLRHLFPFCLLRSRQHILGDLQLYLMQLYSLLALKIERYSFLNIKQTKRLFRPPYWKQVTSHFSQELVISISRHFLSVFRGINWPFPFISKFSQKYPRTYLPIKRSYRKMYQISRSEMYQIQNFNTSIQKYKMDKKTQQIDNIIQSQYFKSRDFNSCSDFTLYDIYLYI